MWVPKGRAPFHAVRKNICLFWVMCFQKVGKMVQSHSQKHQKITHSFEYKMKILQVFHEQFHTVLNSNWSIDWWFDLRHSPHVTSIVGASNIKLQLPKIPTFYRFTKALLWRENFTTWSCRQWDLRNFEMGKSAPQLEDIVFQPYKRGNDPWNYPLVN